MTKACAFCGAMLASTKTLNYHQETNRSCLKIQGINGSRHCCSACGSCYSQKSAMNRHKKTCDKHILISAHHAETINITQNHNTVNNIQNNNNTVNISIYSMSSLTPDYIVKMLQPVITKSLMQAGIGAVTEIVVSTLLQKDGKYIYYCADRSRSKFMMLINHNGEVIEEQDPEAARLRSMIVGPLLEVAIPVAAQNATDQSIQETLEGVTDIEERPKIFTNKITSCLASSSDSKSDILSQIIEDATKRKSVAMIALAKHKKMIEKMKTNELAQKAVANLDEFMGECIPIGGGKYWHKTQYFILKLDDSSKIIIIGWAGKRNDKTINLTKAQITSLIDIGMEDYLDDQYKV